MAGGAVRGSGVNRQGYRPRYRQRQARGKGDYQVSETGQRMRSWGSKAGSWAGKTMGRYVGAKLGYDGRFAGKLGSKAGGALGRLGGAALSKVTGHGDYSVSKNSLVYNVDAIPEFSAGNSRVTMISHREFITDIRGSTEFTKQDFRINPAIASSFPWLSSIAQNYEQYVVQGMLFEFKTTSATAVSSTNTALGTVVMATQYNSLAPPFLNKQQMENYEFAQSACPSQSIIHPIECDPRETQCGGIFNMYNPNDTSGDTRLYDIGRFTIATVGMQAAATVGELWVTYKVALLKPRLQGVTDIFDAWTLDAASIANDNEGLGDTTLAVPFDGNSGICTLRPGDTFNAPGLLINPSFTGILQITLTYIIASGSGITSLINGLWSANENTVFVTAPTEFFTNTTFANALKQTGNDSANNRCVQLVSYVRCTGGYDGPNPPIVDYSGFALTGAPFAGTATLLVSSLPAQTIALVA